MGGFNAAIISQGLKPAPTFAELQAQTLAAQQQKQATQLGALQLSEAQKAQQEDVAFRKLIDPTDDQIYQTLGAQRGSAVVKSRQEARKAGADFQKLQAEVQEKQQNIRGHIAYATSHLGELNDQSVASAAYELNRNGLKDDAARLTQAWQQGGAAAVKPLLDAAIGQSGAVQTMLTQQAGADARTKQANTAAEKLELEKPGLQAKAQQERLATYGQQLGSAPNAAEYQARYNQLMQVDPEAAKQFPAPDGSVAPIVSARKLGMTAPQQAEDANRQAALSETQNYHGLEAQQRQAALAQQTRYQNAELGIQGMNAQTSRGQLAVAQGNLSLRGKEFGQQYGDPLQSLSGAQLEMAKKYASGDFKLPPAGSRAPGAQAIRQAALALNPNLSDDTFTVKHDFNDPSKPGGKNLATMARIAGHIGRFEKNSGAMGTLESGAYGMGATLTGTQKATSEDAHAIAAELEKLTSGGVGSKEQTQGWQTALKSSSASVRQKAVNEISQIIGSQFEGMNAQYKAQTQQDLPLDKYVSPAGREWLKKNNINVSGTAEAPKASTAAPPPAHIQSLREKYKY
jgi:hypothetical protein